MQLENRLVVKKSFSKAIINSKSLSKDKEDLMVVFMLSNIKDIFKVRPNASAHTAPVICGQLRGFPSPGTQSSAQRRE